MADDLAGLRQRLALSLPGRIQAALEGYESFAAAEPPCDSKGFAAWHAAAKSALAHVESLVKLARWAEGGGTEEAEAGVEALLSQARLALDSLDEDEEDSP